MRNVDWHALWATSHWQIYGWLICGLLFLALEANGIIRGRKYATLTTVVKKGCPRWILAAFFGWLLWHFFIEP
jgi:hypothetical protein